MTRFVTVDLDGASWPPAPAPLRAIEVRYDGAAVTMTVDGKAVPLERDASGVWRPRTPRSAPQGLILTRARQRH